MAYIEFKKEWFYISCDIIDYCRLKNINSEEIIILLEKVIDICNYYNEYQDKPHTGLLYQYPTDWFDFFDGSYCGTFDNEGRSQFDIELEQDNKTDFGRLAKRLCIELNAYKRELELQNKDISSIDKNNENKSAMIVWKKNRTSLSYLIDELQRIGYIDNKETGTQIICNHFVDKDHNPFDKYKTDNNKKRMKKVNKDSKPIDSNVIDDIIGKLSTQK